ncbi:hypothetical protein KFK09_013424 [Dendrobium nobile]|uniref:Uncharacterized protein n=1 Tax=Dendrobium nobile TaxID=94219 RepID=A0A8T3B9K4_DENNO|nr:hypothetical protein KFK09_013424 [Dendrobium nobile]
MVMNSPVHDCHYHNLTLILIPNFFNKLIACDCTNKCLKNLQGSGLGFGVIRMGYEDIYIGSSGSFSQKYGKDYFICTGSASRRIITSGHRTSGHPIQMCHITQIH